MKREKREIRKDAPGHESVATRDDLADYGFPVDDSEGLDESKLGSAR